MEMLEVARPESDDLDSRDLQLAAQHLDTCPQCRATFQKTRLFDRQIGQAMRDVPVPADLKYRLLEALQVEATAASLAPAGTRDSTTDDVQSPTDFSNGQLPHSQWRRHPIQVVLALSVCLMVGLATWLHWGPTGPKMLLDDLRHNTPIEIDRLSEFQGDFDPIHPRNGWRAGGIMFSDIRKGRYQNASGKHRMALYRFRFRHGPHSSIEGVLAVVPVRSVVDPPARRFFDAGDVAYTSGGAIVTIAWTEGDLVYVCLVPSGKGAVRALESVLAGTPA
jgi:hypothetical protein